MATNTHCALTLDLDGRQTRAHRHQAHRSNSHRWAGLARSALIWPYSWSAEGNRPLLVRAEAYLSVRGATKPVRLRAGSTDTRERTPQGRAHITLHCAVWARLFVWSYSRVAPFRPTKSIAFAPECGDRCFLLLRSTGCTAEFLPCGLGVPAGRRARPTGRS